MTDLTKLVLGVDSTGVRTGKRDLDAFGRSAKNSESATSALTSRIGGLVGAYLTLNTAQAAISKAMSVQRQFDVINAGLQTATGSADNAKIAFEALSEFATNTPYDLAQVSDSFIKLVNLGLDPSERALTSYGNTASAMGKDLNQLIEAVADASTGEFERLKEFGIKAKSEGNNVSLTFQGVTTTIGKNAQEIEQYLMRLGEVNFAGAMELRMDSLDGKMANLGDSWDEMFRNINNAGLGEAMSGAVDMALSAFDSLNEYLSDGTFEGHLDSMGAAFGPFVSDAEDAVGMIIGLVLGMNDDIEKNNPELVNLLSSAFFDFPENVRASVQIATTWVAWAIKDMTNDLGFLGEAIEAIADGPGGRQLDGIWDRRNEAAHSNARVRDEMVDVVFAERDAVQQAQKAAAEKAKTDREAFEERRKQRAAETADRLAGFRVGADGESATGGVDKAAAGAAKKQAAELKRLQESLETEEEAIKRSYDEREAIIAASVAKGSAEYEKLSTRSKEQYDRELAELEASRSRSFRSLQDQMMSEEEAIHASYDRRIKIIEENVTASDEAKAKLREQVVADRDAELREMVEQQNRQREMLYQGLLTEQQMILNHHEERKAAILHSTLITEQERQDLLRREEERYMRESTERERNRIAMITGSAGDMFGALSGLMSQYAQGSDKQAKKMFKVAQAFSLAQAAISIATGISKAQELGYPMNLIESIRVAAVGATQIAAIKSQSYAGSFDQGGQIPAGKWGWVGEEGPEKVRGPATITGRKLSERSLGGSGDTSINVNVVLNSDGSTQQEDVQGDQQAMKEFGYILSAKIKEEMNMQLRPGGILWSMKHG